MLKKFITVTALAFSLLILLCSCGADVSEKDGLSIVTTVFPQYDFASRITEGTGTQVTMLIPAGSEAHSYDPTPSDMIKVSECDLFIWVGGESEAWAEKIIKSASLEDDKLLSLMDTVPLLETADGHGDGDDSEHEHDGEHDGEHEYDEHVWTSPKNAIIIVGAITEKLCEVDPDSAEIYRKNSEDYLKKLSELDADFEVLAAKASGETLIFGDRFPFLYLTEEYGFEYTSPFRGCSSHTEASMAEIAAVIEKARDIGAKTVFAVDFSNEKLAKTIAEEVGGTVEKLYSCHAASKDDIEKGNGYLELMRMNLESIEKAFATD